MILYIKSIENKVTYDNIVPNHRYADVLFTLLNGIDSDKYNCGVGIDDSGKSIIFETIDLSEAVYNESERI